jgi:hypothetical protein
MNCTSLKTAATINQSQAASATLKLTLGALASTLPKCYAYVVRAFSWSLACT